MAGTMSEADLVASLKESIHGAAEVFKAADDADFKRMLNTAAIDLTRYRPRTLLGEITLSADADGYDAPAGFISFKSALWGLPMPKPWEPNFPGRLPDFKVIDTDAGQQINLVPPPSACMIGLLGAAYKFYYYAAHVIGATAAETTVKAVDRALLILRAQAEAMKEMAIRNAGKPVQLRDGISGATRNSTPAALYDALMKEFERMAA